MNMSIDFACIIISYVKSFDLLKKQPFGIAPNHKTQILWSFYSIGHFLLFYDVHLLASTNVSVFRDELHDTFSENVARNLYMKMLIQWLHAFLENVSLAIQVLCIDSKLEYYIGSQGTSKKTHSLQSLQGHTAEHL